MENINTNKNPIPDTQGGADNTNKILITILVIGVLVIAGWIIYDRRSDSRNENKNANATTTTSMIDEQITLRLYRSTTVAEHTIMAWAVTEDSRCPSDVQCIQAGRAVVALKINSPLGDSIMQVEEGQTITTESLAITLDKVEPMKISTHKTTDDEYLFTLTVKNR